MDYSKDYWILQQLVSTLPPKLKQYRKVVTEALSQLQLVKADILPESTIHGPAIELESAMIGTINRLNQSIIAIEEIRDEIRRNKQW